MNVRYKVVAISGSELIKIDCLPRELLLMIVRRLPIKYLVQAGLINRYFKELVGSTIVQDGFELAELSRFMKFRQEANIPRPIELKLMKSIWENEGPLAVLYRNYQMVNGCMKNKLMADWITDGRGDVDWGGSAASSYVRLNMDSPAVYGLLKVGRCDFYGAIRIRNDQLNMEYYPEKIEKKVENRADLFVEEWVGCEIDKSGRLVAGKIEKKVENSANLCVKEWVGCEIDAGGELVAGKIEKKVENRADLFVKEWVGCEIDAGGELVAGKIEKKVENRANLFVEEWVGCEIEANGKLVGGKIEKKFYRGANGHDFEFLGCEIDAGGELVAGKIEKKSYAEP